jgi:hypothetical protein
MPSRIVPYVLNVPASPGNSDVLKELAELGEPQWISRHWHVFSAGDAQPLETGRVAIRAEVDPNDLGKLVALVQRFPGIPGLEFFMDLAVSAATHWCPSVASGTCFGSAATARAAVKVMAIDDACARGDGVNVVVVDRGIDPGQLQEGSQFGGTIARARASKGAIPAKPAASRDTLRHGTMIARTVLGIAPKVHIWDLRVVPEPNQLIASLGLIRLGYAAIIKMIADSPQHSSQRWIFLNAWGVHDSRFDVQMHPGLPTWRYVSNPDHPFTKYITSDAVAGTHDVVFAAGNGGQFCPSPRQGPMDRGPDRSILGVNGHPIVLSVGAARADGIWIGYSSQGKSRLDAEKPDLCAPTHFEEVVDRARLSSGTSAASAVAAGVMAALRSCPRAQKTPRELIGILRDTATRSAQSGWSRCTGFGVINAGEAFKRL